MNKQLLMCFVGCMALTTTQAQRIDFNKSGSNLNQCLAVGGYVNWSFGRVQEPQIKTFTTAEGNEITLTLEVLPGLDACNGLATDWWKTGVTTNGYRLIGDMVKTVYIDSEGNAPAITSGSTGLQLTVSGLSAGNHTLMAYHCNTDGGIATLAPLDILVDGTTVATGIVQRARTEKVSETPYSYISFTAEADQDVVIQYISKPQAGVSYSRTEVALNALVFDEVNPLFAAYDAYPENEDYHVAADNGELTLQWTASEAANKHVVYFGTTSGNLTPLATLPLATTSYTVKDLYTMNVYYWRIDEIDADGNVYKGEEWSFRPRQLAFPDAEGYGRFAQGGRGGVVYHVTNLSNELTPGSFIYGVTQLEGPRTIVFDVSGIIEMDFNAVFVDPYVTIAGQTAPGKGICLKYSNLNIGSDNICRFLRARRGYGDTGNAMGVSGSDHTIIDHTTAAWGTDETFSSRGAKNITFQYSMIAEALGIADHKNYSSGTNHGYAATIDGRIGSYSHNLLVDCEGRNWSMGGGMDGNNTAIGQMDIFNNVVYNWHKRTTDGGCHEVNFVNNYYKMGADTQMKILFSQDYENVGSEQSTWQAYVSGNIRENKDHTLTTDKKGETYRYTLSNGAETPSYETFVATPFFPSYATIHSAKDAFKVVTSYAGATMPIRDNHHQRMVRETINGTYTYVGSRSGIKGEIDNESDCGGYETFPEETRPADFDTDQDGVPNWYETLVGSDENTADNNVDPNHDGWTQLEDYLEFMAHPYLVLAPGQTQTFNVAPHFRGFTNQPVFTVQADPTLCTATLADSVLTVEAGKQGGITSLTLTVTDAEGSTFSQLLNIAVTGNPTAITEVFNEQTLDIAKKEFFTLDGKPVKHLESQETYLMQITEQSGKIHTVKILKY